MNEDTQRVIVIGAGAAGYFAAITCAENSPGQPVLLLEKGRKPLSKVKVSGGGRCNVTHACFDPKELVTNYPRGGKSLLGAFHRWQPRDTVEWFAERGVELKTEPDGRMFPVTNDSQTIVDCLENAARDAGVDVHLDAPVQSVERVGDGFRLHMKNGEPLDCAAVLLATGGGRGSGGYEFATTLGHTVLEPVPSLFTFHIDDPRLADLAGVSVAQAEVSAKGFDKTTNGPLLITHWGLSGPAILKLSAWGARHFFECNYQFELRVNWTPHYHQEQLRDALRALRERDPKKLMKNVPLPGLTQRLWARLTAHAGISDDRRWNELPRAELNELVEMLNNSRFIVTGKSMFKEEFVTCGGVALEQVDFRTMESRLVPGLFFAGEVLDVDGVTGGFNFQAAWTSGHLAGMAMAQI